MVSEESFRHYKLGHEHIDATHWHLIELMNSAIVYLKNKQTEEVIAVVKSLRDALVQHIAEEEQFMKSIQFPYFESHHAEHDRILDKLDEIPNMLATNRLTEHVVERFEMIIMTHIDHYDMQIVNFMHK